MPSHQYSAAGYYKICVIVTDSNSCSNTFCDSVFLNRMNGSSAIVSVNVVNSLPTASGIQTLTENNRMKISPNPCNNCEIEIANTFANQLQITDLLGRKIDAQFEKTAKGFSITLPNELSGLFFLHNAQTNETIKFVKE